MKKYSFFLVALFPALAISAPSPELSTEIDKQVKIAEPEKQRKNNRTLNYQKCGYFLFIGIVSIKCDLFHKSD